MPLTRVRRTPPALIVAALGIALACPGVVAASGGTAESPLVAIADLSVTLVSDSTYVAEGDSVTFTATVENVGDFDFSAITVQDALPAGLTYANHSRTQGIYYSGLGIWDVGAVAVGASAQLTLIATVDAGTGGSTITSTARLFTSVPLDQNGANDASSAGLKVLDPTSADLVLTKTVDDSLHIPGENAIFRIAVVNDGPADATGIVVRDLLSIGLIYAWDVPSQGTYTGVGGVWTLGSLARGDSATLQLAAKVDAGTEGRTLTNIARIQFSDRVDPDSTNDLDSASVLVPSADLAVTKTVSDPNPAEADSVDFTITVTNAGPTLTRGVVVCDTLPTGLDYVSAVTTAGNYSSGNGIWHVGEVDSGATETLTLTAVVDPGTGGSTLLNVAAITGMDGFDPNGSNDADSAAVTVQSADLAVDATVDDTNPAEGAPVTFDVTVTNLGPNPAAGVQVANLLPAGVTLAGYAADHGDWVEGTGLWTIGSLAASEVARLTLDVTVDGGTAGATITNAAAVAASSQPDPVPANDADSTAIVVQSADLRIVKLAGDSTPNEGETLVYAITVTNLGPSPATGVVAADSLPAGLTWLSDVPSQGTYDPPTGLWTVGAIDSGDAATLAISATVDAGTGGGSITNTASLLAASPPDPVAANDTSSAVVTIPLADLSLTKTVNDPTPGTGQTVTWTIRVANAGPDAAHAIVVADSLPTGLTFQTSVPSQGIYAAGTGMWNVGTVANGGSAQLLISSSVDGGTEGQTLVNTATIASVDEADHDLSDDTATDSVTVNFLAPIESADLIVGVAVDDPTPREGDPVRWTVTLTNAGPDAAGGVAVTDGLPTGATYVAGTPDAGTYDPGTGIWAVGGLGNGATVTLLLDATVDPGTGGSSLLNVAAVTASSLTDPVPGNNISSAGVAVEAADLSLTDAVDVADPDEGAAVTFSTELVNHGPDPVAGAEVTATCPAGVSFVSALASRGSYGGGTGVWTVGAMAPGDTVTLDVTATVDAGTGGTTVVRAAAVTGTDQGDPLPGNESDSTFVTVRTADLVITKMADDPTPLPGGGVDFTIEVYNAGPDSSAGIAVADTLPTGITFQSAVAGQGGWDQGTGTWTVGTLAPLESASLVLTTTVDGGAGGNVLVNRAVRATAITHDGNSANDADSAVVSVELPTGITLAGLQPTTTALPGKTGVRLFTLAVANSGGSSRTLQSIRFTNTTTGPGTVADLDAELGPLGFWRDDGDGVFEPWSDTLLAAASAVGGRVDFTGLGSSIPSGAIARFHVAANLSVSARDGDVLDLEIGGPGDVVFASTPPLLNAWPVAPAGAITVDGMAAAQIAVLGIPSGVVYAGASGVPVLDAIVPRNGYEDDTLQEIRLVNLGTAGPAEVSAVRIWADGGDGTYDGGLSDDVALGTTTWSGSAWELVGLSLPLPSAGRRLFATLDLDSSATPGATLRLGFESPGVGGIVVASGNDGPIDAAVANSGTLTVQLPPATLEITATAPGGTSLLPGARSEPVFRLQFVNPSAVAETLRTITFTNAATGPGSQAQLDASWASLSLLREGVTEIGIGEPAARVPGVEFAAGRATFTYLSTVIAAGDTVSLRLDSGASLTARDTDHLDVVIAGPTDIAFSRDAGVDAEWPLDPPGSFVVDGMTSAQIAVEEPPETNLLTGSTRVVGLSLVLPPNGYQADALRSLDVTNEGTALPGSDLEKLEAWADDDDGVFEEGSDTLLGTMLFTGDRWQLTGLDVPITAPGGSRFFVTLDVADLAEVGRTVRLALPGPSDPGAGVASANDGPIDREVESPLVQTISTVDRVTISAATLTSSDVRPGDTDVLALRILWDNTYAVPRTLGGLAIRNVGTGSGSTAELDAEVARLVVRADDGDGVLESETEDPPIGSPATFANGLATFGGLSYVLPAGASGNLFVTIDAAIAAAADGDELGVEILDATGVVFQEQTSIAADWPVDSGARFPIDGMTAAQIGNVGTPNATLGPDEGPVAALDVVLRGNGYRADVLEQIVIENTGSATAADLADVRLWRDGGNAAFDAGATDDVDLGALAPVAGRWSNPLLSVPLPAGGSRFFVSVTSSSAPTDSATVRFGIPVDGLEMQSDNDGPLDEPVVNEGEIVLSTAALLATLTLSPPASTIDQTVTATLSVRNDGDSTIVNITPSALTPSGLGSLAPLSGPTPATFDLPPDGSADFAWTYRAASSGTVRLSGSVSGVESGTGLPRQSLVANSNLHEIFVEASEVQLWAVESMPFSISRGQTDVVPLSLTIANAGGAGGSAVRVGSLRLQVLDGNGGGIVPADLISRVVIKEGSEIYADRASLETTGDEIDLPFDPQVPLLIESADPPGGQATISIAIDIADSTTIQEFRLNIVQATWIGVSDATSGAPVTVDLQDDSWPVASGLARVVAEATELAMASVPDGPKSAARGQDDIVLFGIEVENMDASGLAADIRLSEFTLEIADGGGAPIVEPGSRLEHVEVRGPLGEILFATEIEVPGDSVVAVSLAPLLSCPVNTPVRLAVRGSIADGATLGTFRVQLSDTAAVDARDANSGAPVAVTLASMPIVGDPVTVEAPAGALVVSGSADFPAAIAVGQAGVVPMRIELSHPGGAGTGPIRCDSLAWRLRNDRGDPVVPGSTIDRIQVRRGTEIVGQVTDVPAGGDLVTVPITGVVLAAAELESLVVSVDVETTAPLGYLELLLGSEGVTAVDANLQTAVPVVAGSGTFPFSSGLALLQAPARELEVAFTGTVPPVLAADGREIPVATLVFENTAVAPAVDIRLAELAVRASDRDGVEYPIGQVATSITATLEGEIVGQSALLETTDATATVALLDTLALSPESPVTIDLRATLRPGTTVSSVRFGLGASDVGVIQPASELLRVDVQAAAGQTFPFWTLSGNFSGTSLAESYANFPNPFAAGRGVTTFAFYLPQPGRVTLRLLTVRGEPVTTLLENEPLPSGLHQDTVWDGRNGGGSTVRNGVYVAEIEVAWNDGGRDRVLRKVAVVR